MAYVRRRHLLPDHADLLRERRAPPRPRVHDDRRRRPRPLAPPRSATTCYFLTGTDEHGQKIAATRPTRRGLSPQEFADSIAPLFAAGVEPAGHLQRRLHPHHRAAPHASRVAELLQRCYDAGDIELDVYRGKYCVRLRGVLHRRRAAAGDLCPIHKTPGRGRSRRRTTSSASAASRTACSTGTTAHPDAIVPEFRGNEALGLIRGGLRDFSVSRTSLEWGIPLPWDPKHVAYVWFDALTNYLTAVGFGTDEERVRTVVAGRRHLIGKDIIRHHCVYWPAMLMSAGIEPPAQLGRRRLAARRRREDEQDDRQRGQPARPGRRRSASTGSATTCSPTRRTATTATSPTRAWSRATTATSPTTSATCCRASPPWSDASAAASVRHRRPTARSPRSPPPRSRRPPRRGTRSQPSRALEATWSLIRATNAYLEANEPWKAEPGPAVDAVLGDALEALRIVTMLASPGAAVDRARRSGSASASPARSSTSASPPRSRGADTPAG